MSPYPPLAARGKGVRPSSSPDSGVAQGDIKASNQKCMGPNTSQLAVWGLECRCGKATTRREDSNPKCENREARHHS